MATIILRHPPSTPPRPQRPSASLSPPASPPPSQSPSSSPPPSPQQQQQCCKAIKRPRSASRSNHSHSSTMAKHLKLTTPAPHPLPPHQLSSDADMPRRLNLIDTDTEAKYSRTNIGVFEYLKAQPVKRLGSGMTGDVVLVEDFQLNYVAMKIFKLDNLNTAKKKEEKRHDFFSEVSILQDIQHANIARMLHPFLCEDYGAIMMNYFQEGNLYHQLPNLTPPLVRRYFIQISKAVEYLHKQNISHRDIKPDNILTSNSNAYLTDFGLAQRFDSSTGFVIGYCGSRIYMAPEVLFQKKCECFIDGRSADSYSMGVLLYTLMARKEPHAPMVLAPNSLDSFSIQYPVLSSVAGGLLENYPTKRTTITEVVQNL